MRQTAPAADFGHRCVAGRSRDAQVGVEQATPIRTPQPTTTAVPTRHHTHRPATRRSGDRGCPSKGHASEERQGTCQMTATASLPTIPMLSNREFARQHQPIAFP